MLTRTILYLFICVFSLPVMGQEVWDLERCVRYAQQNSSGVKQTQYAIKGARLTQKQSEYERYPTLNGSVNGNLNFGRSIDPTTNSFINQRFGSNSFSLNAGVTLYNGGRIINGIKQASVDLEAAKADADITTRNLALNVASAYLSILLAQEQLESAQNRIALTQKQLEQTDRLIQAGALPQNDRLDFLAQIARDEQTIVGAQNSVDINYLNLKQLLELDPGYELRIEEPETVIPAAVNPEMFNLRTIFNQAVSTQPEIRAGELRRESAALGIEIAKSNGLPTVSLFGGVDTYWSSRGVVFEDEQTIRIPQTAFIDGNPINFEIETTTFPTSKANYFNQLQTNFGQSIGINLSIPIYNRNRTALSMERAELGVLNQDAINNQTRQQLKTDIQRAIADAKAAAKSLDAAQKSLAAAEAAYNNSNKRFKLGAVNSFEFTTAKNNFDNAEVELIRAKYEYLFNVKIVEFYQGKALSLN